MGSTLFDAIDLYCERTGPELWSEPLNAISNLAFIAAGVWGLLVARRTHADPFVRVLCWWVVAIGVGSGLFHTFANGLTKWADVLPIAIFTLVYALFAFRRYLELSWPVASVVFVVFFAAAGYITSLMPQSAWEFTNGSIGYLPAFLALSVIGLIVLVSGSPAGWYLVAAALLFLVSVTFRIIDPQVCASLPIGTHFLWHVFNGLMLGVLLAAALRHGQPGARLKHVTAA